ncbi:hypothetical protein [Paracoccus sp. (in: a-proteobacteria)]|uniref:hypothetical protein n=1 Tax=Paracoccus sp. TaxID=267 RepID=UPI002AFFB574|nr:hypothetical protein [Paracoccus sp. (in: a-proteobacteria)]
MEVVWLIVGLTLATTMWFGAVRMASRSFGAMGGGLAALLVAAGLCYLIGESKTGGYLAGIIGMLLSMLMLIAAGGLAAGAFLRWLYGRLRPPEAPRAPLRPAWDVMCIVALAGLAVIFSAME